MKHFHKTFCGMKREPRFIEKNTNIHQNDFVMDFIALQFISNIYLNLFFFHWILHFTGRFLFINPVYYYFSVILSVKAFPVNIFQFSQIFLIPPWSVFDLFFFPFGSPRWKKGLSVNSLVREKEYRKFLSNFNFSLSRYCSCL